MRLSKTDKAYIAGFLDGDGSIYVRLKPNLTYRFKYQISPALVFYQSKKEKLHLVWLKGLIKRGYIRDRNDGIVEYIIGDVDSIKKTVKEILPYLKLKRKQGELMLKILEVKKEIKTAKDFLRVARLIDKFQEINYSKKRTQNSKKVENTLKGEKLLAP